MTPDVTGFFDEPTNTVTYLVADPDTGRAAIIDPVLDFDYAAGRISHQTPDRLIETVRTRGLTVDWLLETHVHADHVTAAPYLKTRLGGRIAIGEHVTAVQQNFARVFNEGPDFARDASQWDRLFADGDRFEIGSLPVEVLFTPGHSPACISYRIGDVVFSGDTLFMPDFGTARCDFPGGSAADLYASIQRLLALPDDTRLYVAHDYLPAGRSDYRWQTTVGESRAQNIHLREAPSAEAFIALREARDATLPMPRLIIPALQINMRGGQMPPADADGITVLKVPLNRL